jgi:sugar/nucleoside kinase (ribokinase family)
MDRVVTPQETVQMPGGTSIYFSNAIAALDVRYALVTSLASHDLGVLTPLQKRGVPVTVFATAHTLFFENIYGDNSDERRQRVLELAEPFTTDQVTTIDASIYHLGTLIAGDIPAQAIEALARKGSVSLDVQGYLRKVENANVVPVDWVEKESVLPHIHFLKANEEELAVLTGQADVDAGARDLLAMGAREVIVTCGSKGSYVYTGRSVYSIPAFMPTILKDATGCGDTYMAGYLYKRCKGAPIQEAGEFAAAMATAKIETSGPFTGTEAAVQQLLLRSKKEA